MWSNISYNGTVKKILIVDDEQNIQVSLASILKDEGYQVYMANDGEEGIEKYQNIKPDAVFIDIWLPKMDGLELMKEVFALDPGQIVFVISGHGSISTAVSALKAGAFDYLEKPLSIDKVVFGLKRAFEFKTMREENLRLKTILEREDASERENRLEPVVPDGSGTQDFELSDSTFIRKQRTVALSNIFYGIGLHSGEKTGMVIRPLACGKGIRFENISEEGYIPARIEYLNTTGYATSIRKDKVEARTIEHFMAVLHAFGITNLSIKINREVPIGDGSAKSLCDFLRESEIVEQTAFIPEIKIERTLRIGEESESGKFIKIEPADCFAVHYTCIYREPLGRQTYEFFLHSPEDFEREIAPARTYGFVDEINKLSEMGLAEGGRMNNFILIDQTKIINTTLRFPEELARHKILDVIGDFYLLGRPIRGKVTAQMTGHADNARLVNLIKETYLKR